jgi:hypothetical protein
MLLRSSTRFAYGWLQRRTTQLEVAHLGAATAARELGRGYSRGVGGLAELSPDAS